MVAVEAGKASHQPGINTDAFTAIVPARERLVSLTERRLAELPVDQRPLPSVDRYDRLLNRESTWVPGVG